ncbi:MAG: Undecaprenyl phosphate-alpha-4-amino-4-deoxy-L-arabinose arabinosyl transferase [Syntrophus sp. PtaB.Bin001]|nr:MAG: Undecaprenyl phosphate-alpha-4-amino-4-deoxy-L-arabinose arabinosyl transferase [Syntrophus sp. PtaB.Bin001]
MKDSTKSAFGNTGFEDRLYNIFLCMLVAGSILVFFWNIWSIPLLTHNEGRRLVVLREMMANHSWLIPTMNGSIYLEKPPLFYWFGAIFGLLANSTSEWVLRLPSALSAMCLVWMLFFGLKEYIGRWAALFGVLILITSSFFTAQARLAELEMLLTFCVFSSLLFYFEYVRQGSRYRLYGAYAMVGFAFLTKGPVALLFFLPPILCYGFLARSNHALKGLIDWRGWLLFSLIAFPWFIYVNAQLQGAPLFGVISNEISTIRGEKLQPFYFYLQSAVTGFTPWILVLLWKPWDQFKKLSDTEAGRFFGLAALVPLIIFSFFNFKRDKYILPMYPALAVWLSMVLANSLEQVKRHRQSVTVVLAAFSALLIAGYIGYYTFVQARTMSHRYAAFPPLAARLDGMRGNAPVYFFSVESIQLVYYYGKPIPVVQKAELEKMLADGKSFLLLAGNKHISNAKGPGLCLLEQIPNFGETNKTLYILASGSRCKSSISKIPQASYR